MVGTNTENQAPVVLGQKYAYATISLILGISCFINLIGMEKAILAVVFGWMALKATPPPVLTQRRVWAKTGVVLGCLILVLVPTIILLNLERLRVFIEALARLSEGR
jgi:hypothetical protein